tara:strand:+ start:428 stop:2203 length:1776 start_codon:yes stop_codon:yes gene_type:complete
MKKLLLVLLCFPLLVFSQDEKRLALVIGNANYDKGELKNPVNDALLMAKTLDSLGFDILLHTNIVNESKFKEAIIEFGDKRGSYDVGFIYYAGHGIQINGKNYLLPTKVDFQKEIDVQLKALNVEMIMLYLTGISDQVNILVLDACRNNPFEENWNTMSRSFGAKGSGLAKIVAPTGTLIAYSAYEGKTAPDGEGDNSIYSQSLAKNMFVKDIPIERVFGNVRSEVLKATNGAQTPEEVSQLTGDGFYLLRSDFKEEFDQIDLSFEEEDYLGALVSLTSILANQPDNNKAYELRGNAYKELGKYEKAEADYTKAINLDPENSEPYYARSDLYNKQIKDGAFNVSNRKEKYVTSSATIDKAAVDYTKAINLDPEKRNALQNLYKANEKYSKGIRYYNLNQYSRAEAYYSKAIELNPKYTDAYYNRARAYEKLKQYDKAEADYNKTIELDAKYINAYSKRANLYIILNQYDKAEADYTKTIELDSKNLELYTNRADFYKDIEQYDKAEADYTKTIELDPEYLYHYYNRADFYKILKKYDEAEADYTKAIELDSKNPEPYNNRADFYKDIEQYDKAKSDYTKAINLEDALFSPE